MGNGESTANAERHQEVLSERQRIYVDLDDVLCRTIETYVALLGNRFGKSVDIETVRWFDLKRSFELSDAQHLAFVEACQEETLLLTIPPQDGAIETVAAWSSHGFWISVVTGRPPSTRRPTEDWLVKHGVRYDELLYVDKYNRRALWDKVDFEPLTLRDLSQASFRLAIEDSAEMGAFLAEQPGVSSVAILDWPWNRNLRTDNRKITRCRSWREIAALLQ